MASYEAIINLVVQGEAALNRIQKKIDNLYKTIGDLETKKKFKGSQAAADFVREQADELERVVSVSKKQIKEQERSIVKQSKLNAAVDLYERRQRQLSRTSVANQKQFADQIRQIEEGFKFFKERKSVTGVQAIATELGRIIEYDNEINRISERRTANQRKLFSFSKEIAKYEAFGLKADRARKTLSNFEEVAGSNQLKKAQQYEAALRNQLKLLKDQLIEQQRVAKLAPSSPILGGVNFPGSPKALTAQRKAEEIALRQSQRGFPSSPISGTPTMLGSPRAIAAQERARVAAEKALRAQERAAKIAENVANKEAEKILRESQKGFPSSPILGSATITGSPRWKLAQESARQKLESAARATERAADRALKEAQKGFPSSPILGTATMAGSPKWKAAQERMARMVSGSGGVAGSGLEQALASLQEARGARQAFLGNASPAQAIDQIVREFNKGGPAAGNAAENITDTFATNLKKGASGAAASAKSFATAAAQAIKDVFGIASPSRFMIELVRNLVNTYITEIQKSYPRIQAATDKAFGEQTLIRNVKELRATSKGFEFTERPSRGFRPFREAQGFGRGTEGATQEFNNMMLDFRKQIAELTTQPEIFSNLLKALPNSRITTDLVGAANRRALASELPSFMSTQRMLGPGELEKAITSAFADYFRGVRTPDPWVGLVGDYRKFINKVVAETKRLDTQQRLLTGSRVAGALPPSSRGVRIAQAYARSEERGRAVMAEGAFPAAQLALSAAGPRSLADSINDLFARISSAIRGSFGGFGGGGAGAGRGAAAGGGGGASNQVAQLLGFDAIADISRVSTRELEALSAAASELRAVLDPTIEGFDRLDNQLRETIGQIGRQIERRAPEAGFLTRQFGPRTARGLSEGLIGGAFPLLFGQGLGAAAGGGIGGFAGGFAGGGLGFGLSLVGTALGTAFDTLNQAAQDTGKALKYPVEGFEKLKEAGLFAGREQEYYISKLIEAGRATEAAGVIQAEIIKKIGVSGVEDLQRLGDSSSRLSKAWAEFNLQLQAAIAGPMADLLNWVGGIVGEINKANREGAQLRDFMEALSPEQQKEYFRRSIELRNQNNGVVDPAAIQALQQEMLPGGVSAPTARLTTEQRDAQKRAQAVTKELQAQVDLQGKQLSLVGLTLEKDGNRYINAAKAVALQEYDNKLLEIKNSWIGQIFNKEQNLAKIRNANLQYAAQLRQINEEVARRQEETYQNSLQAEMSLYQEAEKQYALNIKITEFNQGELAALRERVLRSEEISNNRLAEFYVEEELAMIAARKNGTVEQTARLYGLRLRTLQSELDLEKGVAQQKIAQLQLNKMIATEEAKRQAADPFVQFRQEQQLDEQFGKTYLRLLKEGIRPAEAERLASFERLVSQQLKSLDIQIAIAQSVYDEAVSRGIIGQQLQDYLDNLERLKAARGVVVGEATGGAGPAIQEIPGAKVQEFISTAQQELRDLESVAVRVSQSIGDALGNSITDGVNSMIDGTKTAQEVFADLLKNIANILLQESTRMIATYIAIGIARMFAFGGGSQTAKSFEMPGEAFIPKGGFKFPGAADGAYFTNGAAAFAKGGMFTNSIVSSPTLFQFANGGALSTGVMGEAGPEAIMPLKRGPGGRLGVEASGSSDGILVTVNVDAKGTSVQGNDQQGNQLGRAISAAVQQELIKQKRPGGLLA